MGVAYCSLVTQRRGRLVPPLLPGLPGDRGTTGPDSITWLISRERAVTLGGLSALLLQLAHPLIAAAVADHSDFVADPLSRLTATLDMLLVTTFGDLAQVDDMARKVERRHKLVTGELSETAGNWPAGATYSALDPELCLWVYATVIEMAMDAYGSFIRPLDSGERETYYRETETFGSLFGVTRQVRPPSYAAFRTYYAEMLSQLTVSEQAKALARAILRSDLNGVPLWPCGQVLAAALLPRSIRDGYGLNWSARQRLLWGLGRVTVQTIMTGLAPDRLRFWGHYRVALVRCSTVSDAAR
jgi:uncharacterized protein (DUF2236 family)